MSEQSVIVWDLETVPDQAAADRILDMPKASDAKLREAEDPSDQSAKSADKLRASKRGQKAIANPCACVVTDYVSLRAQPSNGQLAAASCCR